MKAVIFDRDGTLIKYKPYLYKIEDVELIEGAAECLNKLQEKGVLIFLHTNQSGVERGYFTINDVEKVNREMMSLMGFQDRSLFQEVCIATDLHESENSLRKPSPKFANHVMKKYNISNYDLFIVGDNISDVKAAVSANCKAIWFSSEWSIKLENCSVAYERLYHTSTYEQLTAIILEDSCD